MVPEQEDKYERIILAAIGLFAQKGFAKTSMADIARAAGIGKGTTYTYFKGKDQLFFAAFEWFIKYSENAAKLSLKTLVSSNSTEKIRVFADSILNSIKESEDFYPIVLEFWAATASSKYRKEMKNIFKSMYTMIGDYLGAIIEEGIENGEFDHDIDIGSTVPAIVGAWDAIGLQAWFYNESDKEFNVDKTMRGFTDLMIRGLIKK